ncbi:MAG: hypothetical protein ACRC0L_08275 [Angustibacter sp.]
MIRATATTVVLLLLVTPKVEERPGPEDPAVTTSSGTTPAISIGRRLC